MQRVFTKSGLALIVGVLLAFSMSVSHAQFSFAVIGVNATCSGGASITLDIMGYGNFTVTASVSGVGQYDSASIFINEGGTETFTVSYPELTDGDYTVEFYGSIAYGIKSNSPRNGQTLLTRVTINCGEKDERFCFAAGEAKAAVYGFKDGENFGIEIWGIDANNSGQRIIRMTASEIDEKTQPGQLTLLNSSVFNAVKVYRLADGRFQINVGPAGEKKVHVCIFDSVPPTRVDKYTLEY